MPEYEGVIASLSEDGKAEVIVQPETSNIVGAPEVSKKVCHCASSSSQVTLEALNPVTMMRLTSIVTIFLQYGIF